MQRFSTTRILLVSLLLLIVGAACAFSPNKLRIEVGGDSIGPDIVDEIDPFTVPYSMAIDGSGNLLVVIRDFDSELVQMFMRRPNGVWSRVNVDVPGEDGGYLMRMAGSSRVFFNECRENSGGPPATRFFEWNGQSETFDELKDDRVDLLADEILADTEYQCSFGWEIASDGSWFVSANSALYRVLPGEIEIRIEDTSKTGLPPAECVDLTPRFRLGEQDEILLFYPPKWGCSGSRPALWKGGQFHALDSGANITSMLTNDVVAGPDGAGYYSAHISELDDDGKETFESKLLRIDENGVRSVMKGGLDPQGVVEEMAFDADGRLYAVVSKGGDFIEPKAWIVRFPTHRAFSR